MRRYRSIKIVEAARINEVMVRYDDDGNPSDEWEIHTDDPTDQTIVVQASWFSHRLSGRSIDHAVGGYLIRYADGYLSWSPPEAFETGYEPLA